MKPLHDKKLSRLVIRAMDNFPHYANFLIKARYYTLKEDEKQEVPPAQVAYGKDLAPRITFRHDYWGKVSNAGWMPALIHEVLHPTLEHKQPRDQLEAIACDMAINDNLVDLTEFERESGYTCIHYKDFQRKDGLAYPPVRNSGEYYRMLKEDYSAQSKPSSGDGEGQGGGDFQVIITNKHTGQQSTKTIFPQSKKFSGMEKQQFAESIRESLETSWDSLPAELRRVINKWLAYKTEVSWKTVLRQFMGNCIRGLKVSTWHKRNRRIPGFVAGSKRHRLAFGAVCIDVSGSMSDKAYRECVGEVEAMSKYATMDVYCHAVEVKKVIDNVTSAQAVSGLKERVGYGGTDFRPVLKQIKERKDRKYSFVILFTDTAGAWPDRSEAPLCPHLMVHFGKAKLAPEWIRAVHAKPEVN